MTWFSSGAACVNRCRNAGYSTLITIVRSSESALVAAVTACAATSSPEAPSQTNPRGRPRAPSRSTPRGRRRPSSRPLDSSRTRAVPRRTRVPVRSHNWLRRVRRGPRPTPFGYFAFDHLLGKWQKTETGARISPREAKGSSAGWRSCSDWARAVTRVANCALEGYGDSGSCATLRINDESSRSPAKRYVTPSMTIRSPHMKHRPRRSGSACPRA
jgi:hypothetical protein